MSLFNIVSIHNLFFDNLKIIHSQDCENLTTSLKKKLKYSSNSNKNLYACLYSHIFIGSNNISLSNFKNSNNNFSNKQLISPSFLAGFINKYWQETIFISKFNLVSEKYINQLKSDGLSINNSQYKKFLFHFSRALIKGRIHAHLNEDQDINTINKDSVNIQYVWRKGLNFLLPNIKNFSSLGKYNQSHLSKKQTILIKKLKSNKLPIFTVTNNDDQIIIAEPSDELMYSTGVLDNIYEWYYNNFISYIDQRPAYEGLFFMNPEDALEYKEYINNKYSNYNLYSKQGSLNIFASSLDNYYRLTHNAHPRVKFYLVPDLKELAKLIYKYQYHKNINFHQEQQYGKYYFQGQPVYIIQPVYCKNHKTKTTDKIEYVYELKQNNQQESYNAIFMSYEVALIAWQKFICNNKNYYLPSKPNILVYNLEGLLQKHKETSDLYQKDMLFMPDKESYQFINIKKQQNYNNPMFQSLAKQFLYLQAVSKKLIWSLTSRQPVNL